MTHILRTIYGVDDDLQQFAQDFLNREAILSKAISMRNTGPDMVVVLCKEGNFQVELFCVPAGFVINSHRHPHADTIEVPVAGLVRLNVNGEEPFSKFSDDALQKMRWRGLRINHDDVHGGTASKDGAMFLSIQRWTKEPTSVQTDYIGIPNGPEHARLLHGHA